MIESITNQKGIFATKDTFQKCLHLIWIVKDFRLSLVEKVDILDHFLFLFFFTSSYIIISLASDVKVDSKSSLLCHYHLIGQRSNDG